MIATHTDYQHPRHLRVTCEPHRAWNTARGWFMSEHVCLAPSHSDYAKMNKPGLPAWNPLVDDENVRAYRAARKALA